MKKVFALALVLVLMLATAVAQASNVDFKLYYQEEVGYWVPVDDGSVIESPEFLQVINLQENQKTQWRLGGGEWQEATYFTSEQLGGGSRFDILEVRVEINEGEYVPVGRYLVIF